MKRTMTILLIAAAFAASAETWYYTSTPSRTDALTDPQWWTNSVGTKATAFTADDDYQMFFNLRTPNGEFTFAGGNLIVATASASCQINLYSLLEHYSKLTLVRGVLCTQGGNGRMFTITGDELYVPSSGSVRWSYSNETVTLDIPLTGPSTAIFDTDVRNLDRGDRNETLALAQSCPDFEGTLAMKRYRGLGTQTIAWPDWWTRLVIKADNFTMPGTVSIEDGSLLEVTAGTASLGKLILDPGSRLKLHRVPGGGGLTIADSLTMTGTAANPALLEIVIDETAGHTETNVYPLFTVPLASRLNWAGIDLRTIGGLAVPGSYLTITTNATAGTEALSLVEPPCVKLMVSDIKWKDQYPSGLDTTSAFDKAESWSNGDTPKAGFDYIAESVDGESVYLRTRPDKKGYEFPGDSLTIRDGCIFVAWEPRLTIPMLRLLDGAMLWTGQNASNPVWIDGPVEVPSGATAHLGPYQNGRLLFNGAFTGAGTLLIEGVRSGTSGRRGFTRLTGDNSGFLGRMQVVQYYEINSGGLLQNGQFLEFDKANALGGTLPAFDAEALTIGYLGRLTPIASVTLDASSNRGLYIKDNGIINVTNAEDTLTVNWPLKVNGTVTKWGPGTLALGGALATNGNCRMEIEQGAVRARTADAMNGLTLAFSPDSALLFDLADMPAGGMRNLVETPFELAEGMTELPVAVKGDASQALAAKVEVPLVTVSAAAFPALQAIWPESAPRPYRACKAEWTFTSDATTGTVGLRLTPIGTRIHLR